MNCLMIMMIPLLSMKWSHIYTQSAEFNTAEVSGDPQTDLQSRTSSVIDNSLEQRHRHLTERALWSGHGSCNSNRKLARMASIAATWLLAISWRARDGRKSIL